MCFCDKKQRFVTPIYSAKERHKIHWPHTQGADTTYFRVRPLNESWS